MLLTSMRGGEHVDEGCRNPATCLTSRISAKGTRFRVPPRGATPASRQSPEKGEELTRESVGFLQHLAAWLNTAPVSRGSTPVDVKMVQPVVARYFPGNTPGHRGQPSNSAEMPPSSGRACRQLKKTVHQWHPDRCWHTETKEGPLT